jgi:hypothetical protein
MDDFNRSPAVPGVLKMISPAVIRRQLRSTHKRYIFRRAIGEFVRDPAALADCSSSLIADFIYGWDNTGWSAFPEFLSACVHHALATNGSILECGSGLTTVLLGLIAQQRKRTVWSLEDSQNWGDRVERVLKRNDIDCVHISTRPLKDFGEFSWYDPPLENMPEFSLVVCDGPPSKTPGGRYGLLPVMRKRLSSGAIILLDDAARKDERDVAARWASEFHLNYELLGSDRPFVRLTVPKSNQALGNK